MSTRKVPAVDTGSCSALGADLLAAARVLAALPGADSPAFRGRRARLGSPPAAPDPGGRYLFQAVRALHVLGMAVEVFAADMRAAERFSDPNAGAQPQGVADGHRGRHASRRRSRARHRLRVSARTVEATLLAPDE